MGEVGILRSVNLADGGATLAEGSVDAVLALSVLQGFDLGPAEQLQVGVHVFWGVFGFAIVEGDFDESE
jgi:thiamine monophosphate kinase